MSGRSLYYARRSRLAQALKYVEPAFNTAKFLYGTGKKLAALSRKRSQPPAIMPKKRSIKMYEAISGKNGGNSFRIKAKRRRSQKKVPLKVTVNRLKKVVNINDSVFTSFINDASSLSSAINRCAYGEYILTNAALFETMLSKVPYTNPAATATKAEVNYTGITTPVKWRFNVFSKWTFRNNYVKPLEICVYVVKPVSASNQGPVTTVTSGLTNMEGSTAITTLNPSFYPSHSKQFNDNWKIIASQKKTLEAGDEFMVNHAESFTYDSEYNDVYTLTHQPKWTRLVLVRIQGKCGHDATTSTLVGLTASQVDICNFSKIKIKYPGNAAPIQSIAEVLGFDAVADDIVATQQGQSNT